MDDPRCPRAKKHDLAEVLTCLVVGYLTGHTGLRRCHDWCCRHLNWLRQGMELKNGIASVSTIFRLVSTVDETLFLCSFMEWIGEILDTRGLHIAIDGKALRASLSKVKGGHTPMLLNAIDTATGLVLAQLPIQNKDCEITEIPELLKLLDIQNSIITTDAIGTQTNIMQQIVDQGAHFVMMVKKNQPTSYDEITRLFSELETDAKLIREGKSGYHHYDLCDKYYFCKNFEKNRDRNETRLYETCSEPSYITKTHKEWPFVKTIGLCKQLRILRISNNDGTDITVSACSVCARRTTNGRKRSSPARKGSGSWRGRRRDGPSWTMGTRVGYKEICFYAVLCRFVFFDRQAQHFIRAYLILFGIDAVSSGCLRTGKTTAPAPWSRAASPDRRKQHDICVRSHRRIGVQGRNPLPWGPGPRRPRESGMKQPPRRGLFIYVTPADRCRGTAVNTVFYRCRPLPSVPRGYPVR
ncbi:MAG: ISAs1 family transposase [Clostridia bacterium]|nr:ISAs1 family transposase [Clostridia bacterium]